MLLYYMQCLKVGVYSIKHWKRMWNTNDCKAISGPLIRLSANYASIPSIATLTSWSIISKISSKLSIYYSRASPIGWTSESAQNIHTLARRNPSCNPHSRGMISEIYTIGKCLRIKCGKRMLSILRNAGMQSLLTL